MEKRKLPSLVAEFSATHINFWPLGCHIYVDELQTNNCTTIYSVCLQFCLKRATADTTSLQFQINIMGETSEEKHEDKVEKKEKKDKEKHEGGEDEKKKEKKKKDPADKKDPTKLRQKLEKLETKMQALAVKKEEVLKLLHEAEQNAPPSS